MGLAMWKTEESFKDIRYIRNELDADLHTALTNPNKHECKDDTCNGNLVNTTILQSCFLLLKRSLSLTLSSEVAASTLRTNRNLQHDTSL